MRTIKVKLSANGIANAVRELKAYQREIGVKAARIVAELAGEGEKFAVAAVVPFSQTGELLKGIKSEASGNVGAVKCDCGYAVYVEFGTGVVGKRNPHPDTAILGWIYDVNSHGELGWWYPTDDSDVNPTKRRAKSGKLYAWTKGLPSRPFMYETAEKLRGSVVPIARSVFS